MLGNRRNFVFRVSIVINVCVLLYTAMHLSGNMNPNGEWVTVPVSGAEGADMRYLVQNDLRNESTSALADPTIRNYDESTSQKGPATTTTAATTNHTVSSTAAMTDPEKRIQETLNHGCSTNFDAEQYNNENVDANANSIETTIEDENYLTQGTLKRLRVLLGCHDRDYETRFEQRGEFWVLKNYVRADHGPVPCHDTITYTTHAGFKFLDNVQPLIERWRSSISLAIHAPGHDLEPTVNSIRYFRDCLNTDLVRKYVTFHVFFSYKHMPPSIPDPEKFLKTKFDCSLGPPYKVNSNETYATQKSLLYPVNVARNIARDAALTHFILPADIELYPSPNLIPKFLNMIARNQKPLSTSKKPRVFPLSVFEVDAKVGVPTSKTELQKMLHNKTAIPFHKYVCPNCHNIPQGLQWMNAKETDEMDVFHIGKRRGKHVHWEPIFIGTHVDPYYDERLSWDGKKDKMPQGYVLCVKDYDFMILNNAFLIHKPGIKKYVKDSKRDTIAGRQSAFVHAHVLPELKKLYGVRAGCAL